MGSGKTTVKNQRAKLNPYFRRRSRAALRIAEDEYASALAASKELDLADPELSGAVRDQYLSTVRGEYLDDPRLDAMAGRAADIAQRGLGGASRRFGSGAYANAVLGARTNAADAIYGRERDYQVRALGMGPEMYELATSPQRDIYRRRVQDPTRLASALNQTLAVSPLGQEGRVAGTSSQPFDWGGFFGNMASQYASGQYGGNDSGTINDSWGS